MQNRNNEPQIIEHHQVEDIFTAWMLLLLLSVKGTTVQPRTEIFYCQCGGKSLI